MSHRHQSTSPPSAGRGAGPSASSSSAPANRNAIIAHHLSALGDPTTSDFTIVAEHKEIAVHRSTLTRTSPFLNAFLTADPSCTRINANNAKYEAMLIVLGIMYTANTPSAATHGGVEAFANSRYDFSIILSAWEIAMHFQLSEVAAMSAHLLLPLVSRYTAVRALRSCLKHPRDHGANLVKDAAAKCLPPLLDTEEQRTEWKVLKDKYIIVSQLVAEQEEAERAKEREERRNRDELAAALAEKERELERVEKEKRELSVSIMNNTTASNNAGAAAAAAAAAQQQQQMMAAMLYNSNAMMALQQQQHQGGMMPSPHHHHGLPLGAPSSVPHPHHPSGNPPLPFAYQQQQQYGHQQHADPSLNGSNHAGHHATMAPPAGSSGDSGSSSNGQLRLRDGVSLSPQRSAAQTATIAALEEELTGLKRSFAAEQEEHAHAVAHLRTLASDIGAHDVEVDALQKELDELLKNTSDCIAETARLEAEQQSFSEAVAENEEYIRNANVYVPAAHEAVKLLTANVDTIIKTRGNNGSDQQQQHREMFKQLLVDLRRDKVQISAELQSAQKVCSGLKHHIQSEKDKSEDITDQLMEMRSAAAAGH